MTSGLLPRRSKLEAFLQRTIGTLKKLPVCAYGIQQQSRHGQRYFIFRPRPTGAYMPQSVLHLPDLLKVMYETRAFAVNGIEKMLYDVRMGPQAVYHGGTIYVVYQADPEQEGLGHPHIRAYDVDAESWSEPVRLGSVHRYDHHYAPILWFGSDERLHVLFGCHRQDGGRHLVSSSPRSIDAWADGPEVDHSISYPRVLPLPDRRYLMYSRTFGHQGYWTYRLSEDGTHWSTTSALIDFDQDPQVDGDTWAGTYQSVGLDADGRGLHICVTTFHEGDSVRKRPNPRYGVHVPHSDRRNLYYVHLDIDSGELTNIEGEAVRRPMNRDRAEACKVWDSDRRFTNPPAVLDDGSGSPMMILPVASEESPWQGEHVFVRRKDGEWKRDAITSLNNTWSGNWLFDSGDGLTALLTTGDADGSLLEYGGGRVERWTSENRGDSWSKREVWEPDAGLIYNNPRPVPTSRGEVLNGAYTMMGWEGPTGLGRKRCIGRAYLRIDGQWAGDGGRP